MLNKYIDIKTTIVYTYRGAYMNYSLNKMFTNKELMEVLGTHRELSKFARFVKMSPQGLYKRLKSDKIKDNLCGQYFYFLLKEKGI